MNILVTGGAGFIGSHTVDALLREGHTVRILDSLQKPVHLKGKPAYLAPDDEFILGDVRDRDALLKALQGVEAVFHFAAYQDYLPDFSTFYAVNAVGTALLYELIVEHRLPVRKIVVATSQAVAGEGLYRDVDGVEFVPDMRPLAQLEARQWEIVDALGRVARCQATPEHVSNPRNPYGMSKLAQELLSLTLGRRYDLPTVCLRYSIVQGPRQSFYNAYSGACRIFCLSAYFDKPPVVYEDGLQVRDFVNIHDVVDANLLVLRDARADHRVFNVGGGCAHTVLDFAHTVCDVFGKPLQPVIPGSFRFGDTRHIVSDIRALQSLGWTPRRTPRDSVVAYVEHLRQQPDVADILAAASARMKTLNVVREVPVS